MKRSITQYSLITIGLAAALSACEKNLDLTPQSQISDASFWKTPTDAKLGVASIYDGMQDAYRTKYYLWGEFRGDGYDVDPARASQENLQLVVNDLQPSNASVLRWNDFYTMINRANVAIAKIPGIPAYDPNLLAEAHALRAYAYFDAIRVWGKVPLFTEPLAGLTDDAYKSQTEGAEIMQNVILPDILKAEQLMTIPTHLFRFSKASVWALQADIYWYLKDYAKAKAALDKIIALNAYTLVKTRADWQKLFLADAFTLGVFETGPEQIMNLKYDLVEDKGQAGNSALFFAGIPSFFISNRLETKWTTQFPTDSLGWVTKYPANPPLTTNPDGTKLYGDWRFFESREEGRPIGGARVAKYQKLNQNPTFDETDIHIYRYAGILLLKGIIENRLNNKTEAVAMLNQIRVARQLPQAKVTDFATVEALEDALLDERSYELLGEGKRWWDLVNSGKAVKIMGPINGLTDQRVLFPVYDRHLIDNPKLVQTPGY